MQKSISPIRVAPHTPLQRKIINLLTPQERIDAMVAYGERKAEQLKQEIEEARAAISAGEPTHADR